MTRDNGTPGYLIGGASGGIGSRLARSLAEKGARLHLAGRRRDPLEELAEELDCSFTTVDGKHFDRVDRLVATALEELGGLDGAVNCAGSLLLKPAHLTSEREYQRVLDDNLTTAFALIRALARHVRRGPLSLVLLSSAVARIGLANHEAIAAAKAGVAGLARSAAATYARRGFRVNAVAPGLVETPLTEQIVSRDAARQASLALHPLGRFGEAADVAGLIAWLLSDEASWMTGEMLHMDGGLAGGKTLAAGGG